MSTEVGTVESHSAYYITVKPGASFGETKTLIIYLGDLKKLNLPLILKINLSISKIYFSIFVISTVHNAMVVYECMLLTMTLS